MKDNTQWRIIVAYALVDKARHVLYMNELSLISKS